MFARSHVRRQGYQSKIRVWSNALDSSTIRSALEGVDVVVQSLGVDIAPRSIFECTTLFSQSTRILVDAMKITGVKRLIAVTGLGAGDSRGHGGMIMIRSSFRCC
jgi:putative NADH-flavin reductase